MLINDQPHYKYEPLSGQADSFRLLELESADDIKAPIRCRLRNSTLAAADGRFAALSYMWGTPGDRVIISLDGKDFYVQQNLCRLLCQARHFRYDTLWVDAICVDQNDLCERSSQVKLMQQLYVSVEHVVAYLGEEADGSDLLFDYLNKLANLGKRPNDVRRRQAYSSVFPKQDGFPLYDALKKLCNRKYWSRLWVVQEVVLPEEDANVHLICGRKRIRMSDLSALHIHVEAERKALRRR